MKDRVQLFLRRYPHLRDLLPMRCVCGAEMTIARETLDERFNGLRTEPCSACGAPPADLVTYVDKEEMAKVAAEMRAFLAGGAE